jgi:N-hydroxyarylamine O-acetyltransferase
MHSAGQTSGVPTDVDADVVLRRIGKQHPSTPSDSTLTMLHEAFRRSIPSEDYDIHTGIPLSLELSDIQDKIIRRCRGGFCYELNGLFAALLTELGFEVTMVSAFTLTEDGTRGPDFDHMRLLVDTITSRWIADVGNGAMWMVPVPASPGEYGNVRVHQAGDLWWTSERKSDGRWVRDWAWVETPRILRDFADRCVFHERDPDSYFVLNRFAVRPTESGRISLLNGVFSDISDGIRVSRELSRQEELTLLRDRFGIVPDGLWPEHT